jgi:CheY-like chemotaxis protein
MLMESSNAIRHVLPGIDLLTIPREVVEPGEALSESTVDRLAGVSTTSICEGPSQVCAMASPLELRPTVILADDHSGFLESVSRLLAPEFEIVATAMDGKQAVSKVMLYRPDVVVLDVSMPEMNGLEAVLEMRKVGVNSKVVLLTVHQSADYVSRAFENGADAFVFKSRMNSELVPAIRKALSGGTFASARRFKESC